MSLQDETSPGIHDQSFDLTAPPKIDPDKPKRRKRRRLSVGAEKARAQERAEQKHEMQQKKRREITSKSITKNWSEIEQIKEDFLLDDHDHPMEDFLANEIVNLRSSVKKAATKSRKQSLKDRDAIHPTFYDGHNRIITDVNSVENQVYSATLQVCVYNAIKNRNNFHRKYDYLWDTNGPMLAEFMGWTRIHKARRAINFLVNIGAWVDTGKRKGETGETITYRIGERKKFGFTTETGPMHRWADYFYYRIRNYGPIFEYYRRIVGTAKLIYEYLYKTDPDRDYHHWVEECANIFYRKFDFDDRLLDRDRNYVTRLILRFLAELCQDNYRKKNPDQIFILERPEVTLADMEDIAFTLNRNYSTNLKVGWDGNSYSSRGFKKADYRRDLIGAIADLNEPIDKTLFTSGQLWCLYMLEFICGKRLLS